MVNCAERHHSIALRKVGGDGAWTASTSISISTARHRVAPTFSLCTRLCPGPNATPCHPLHHCVCAIDARYKVFSSCLGDLSRFGGWWRAIIAIHRAPNFRGAKEAGVRSHAEFIASGNLCSKRSCQGYCNPSTSFKRRFKLRTIVKKDCGLRHCTE